MKNNLFSKNILILFLILSPVIDLTTSFTTRFSSFIFTPGMIIRFAFLLYWIFYLFFITKNKYKKISVIYIVFIAVFIILHLCNIIFLKGFSTLFSEMKVLVKIFYFPICIVAIFNCFYDNNFKNLSNTLKKTAIIYSVFIVLPHILNLSFSTYSNNNLGGTGFFFAGNEISAILAILSPFIISALINKADSFISYIVLVIYSAVVMSIGTKVAFLGVLIPYLSYFLLYVFNYIFNHDKKKSLLKYAIKPILVPTLISVALIIITFLTSNTMTNISLHKESLISKKHIETKSPTETKSNISPKLNKKDYVNLLFSSRDYYFEIMLQKFKSADSKEKILGLGYVDPQNSFNRLYNITEIDYADVFYLYGIIGFLLYFAPLFILTFDILKTTLKKCPLLNDEKRFPFYISLFLILGIALFAGHVFTAPAVSIFPAVIIPYLYIDINSKKNKKRLLMDKVERNLYKVIVFLIIIIFIAVFYIIYLDQSFSEINFKIKDNKLINDNVKLVTSSTTKDDYNLGLTDIKKQYKYCYGKQTCLNIILVERRLSNEDKFYFLEFNNNTSRNFKISLSIDIQDNTGITKRVLLKQHEIKKPYSNTVGYDKTSLPIGYYEYESGSSILISKGFVYNSISTQYDINNYSNVKKLITENEAIENKGMYIQHNLNLKRNESYDAYYIISNDKLFLSENSITDYYEMLNYTTEPSWLSYKGSYHKLPYSIEPYTKDGYGRNPGAVISKAPKRILKKDASLIFSHLIENSIFTLLNYMPKDISGLYTTEYTSTWLKKDYMIRAPYIDTRHNEVIGYYLREIGDYYKNEKIKLASLNYSNYLLDKYKDEDFLIFDEGILFPDYFSNNHQQKTHASLNHQLAIINYLLNSFIHTQNEYYKNLGLLLLSTIENQYELWIREDKDLWYQINSKKEFHGRDYKILTLNDLINTQNLLNKLGEKRSKEVSNLITSKYQYLKDIKYDVPKDLVKMLEELKLN